MNDLDPDALIVNARGSMRVGWGTEVEANGGDSDLAAVASEHERLHVRLGRSTSFGVLLRICAAHRPMELLGLIEMSRTTEEVFATYLSVGLASRPPDVVLAPYPDYLQYLNLGRRIAGDFRDGSVAARCAVSAATQVAMQVPMSGMARMLADHDTEIALPRESQPDVRLGLLVDLAPELGALAEGYPTTWADRPIRDLLSAKPNRQIAAEVRTRGKTLTQAFYMVLQEALADSGFPCLAWDEQTADPAVRSLSAMGERDWVPRQLGFAGLPTTKSHQFTRLDGLRELDTERWIQPDAGGRMNAEHLTDVFAETASGGLRVGHLITRQQGVGHLLIVARPLHLILEQYALTAQSRVLLAAAAPGGVVTAVRATIQEPTLGRLTVLGVLTSASQLARLTDLGLELGMFTSIAHSVLGVVEWAEYWLPALHAHSEIVLTCDIPFSQWLETAEAEATPPKVHFYSFETAGPANDTPTQVLAIEYEGAEGKVDHRQLFLGGPLSVNYLADLVNDSAALDAAPDPDILARSQAMRTVTERLVFDEPWFDRRGVEYLRRTLRHTP